MRWTCQDSRQREKWRVYVSRYRAGKSKVRMRPRAAGAAAVGDVPDRDPTARGNGSLRNIRKFQHGKPSLHILMHMDVLHPILLCRNC